MTDRPLTRKVSVVYGASYMGRAPVVQIVYRKVAWWRKALWEFEEWGIKFLLLWLLLLTTVYL